MIFQPNRQLRLACTSHLQGSLLRRGVTSSMRMWGGGTYVCWTHMLQNIAPFRGAVVVVRFEDSGDITDCRGYAQTDSLVGIRTYVLVTKNKLNARATTATMRQR